MKYDVALSYASEDRQTVKSLADMLDSAGYVVFYDKFEQAELWGADLSIKLKQVFKEEARFCVVFVSKHYAQKPWTNQERQAALSRAFKEKDPYILPIRLDDTELSGLSDMLGYLDLRSVPVSEVFALLSEKLGPPTLEEDKKTLTEPESIAVDRVREVLAACYRRAIFARVHAQMSIEAMFDSLADCRSTLQKLVVFVEPEELQALVAGIIGELDFIERRRPMMLGYHSYWEYWETGQLINQSKLRIISALLKLSNVAGVSFVMPSSITEEAFFTKEQAAQAPSIHESPTLNPPTGGLYG